MINVITKHITIKTNFELELYTILYYMITWTPIIENIFNFILVILIIDIRLKNC